MNPKTKKTVHKSHTVELTTLWAITDKSVKDLIIDYSTAETLAKFFKENDNAPLITLSDAILYDKRNKVLFRDLDMAVTSLHTIPAYSLANVQQWFLETFAIFISVDHMRTSMIGTSYFRYLVIHENSRIYFNGGKDEYKEKSFNEAFNDSINHGLRVAINLLKEI